MTRDEQILSLVPTARRIARAFANVTSLDRDECESEAMFSIILAVDKFDPKRGQSLEDFGAHRVREALRRLLRKPASGIRYAPKTTRRVEIEEAADLADDEAGPDVAVVDKALATLRTASVRNALRQLTVRDKTVVVHRANDVPVDQIASALGVSPKTVRNVSTQAFARLRETLHDLT